MTSVSSSNLSTVATDMSQLSQQGISSLYTSNQSGLGLILVFGVTFCFSLIYMIVYSIVYSIPNFVVTMLSTNFQITLSLSSILLALIIIITICCLILRYKFLTRYSRNTRSDEAPKNPNQALDFLGSIKENKRGKSKLSNYLDEFLSAVKVFGYLERSIFHELTRNMSTQKLMPDEVIYLDEKLGFLIVVEGVMQIFTKIHNNEENEGTTSNSYENELNFEENDTLIIGTQRYQLLNEVKSGAPLSSLMGVLDLFNEHEEISFDGFDLASPRNLISPNDTGTSSIDPLSQNDSKPFQEEPNYPDIVARSKPNNKSNDFASATLSIIPRLAFRKIHMKFPKATSHIVTMVLTRLYKVTMNTMHNYLGLTREIIESETKLNQLRNGPDDLPRYLYDGIIKKMYANINYNEGKQDSVDSISLKNAHNISTSLIDNASKRKRKHLERLQTSRYVALDSRSKSTHPGDLLSSVPLSRRSDYYQTHTTIHNDSEDINVTKQSTSRSHKRPDTRHLNSSLHSSENIRSRTFSDEREETEESSLRIAIIENVFKIIGMNEVTNLSSSAFSGSNMSSVNSSFVGLPGLAQRFDSVDLEDNLRSRSSSLNGVSRSYGYSHVYGTIKSGSQKKSIDQDGEEGMMSVLLGNKDNNTHQPVETKLNEAKNDFAKCLELKYITPNTTIVEQNSFNSGLYYVIDGTLDVIYTLLNRKPNREATSIVTKVYSVKRGEIAGYLNSVVGYRSLVSIKTPENNGAIVAHLPKKEFSKLMDKYYFLQLPVARRLKSLLSRKTLTIDYALEWCHLTAGGVLYAQGDQANGFHIVLSGRFREVHFNDQKEDEYTTINDPLTSKEQSSNLIDESNSKHQSREEELNVLGEYGHGESIGEVEVLTASLRTNTIIAVRDSETARIPRTLFEMLSIQNPSLMVKVSRIVANRIAAKKDSYAAFLNQNVTMVPSSTTPHISNDYKTITILPTVIGLPVREFADRLVHALKTIGRNVIALDHASTLTHLGRYAFDERLSQLKLSGYFAYLEEEYETVVYVCDTPVKSNWTSTCISQGDCVLLLADAEDLEVAANIGEYERLLIQSRSKARTDLCLIHPERYVNPGSTSVWLKNRIWVQGHHHIEMEITRSNEDHVNKKNNLIRDIAATISNRTNPNIRSKLENVKTKAMLSLNKFNDRIRSRKEYSYKSVQSHKNDFLRLARLLSNEGVGLVLGGGGSRGISHVGIVMALEKHGFPIDLVGGTSIGAFVGGLYARDYNIVSMYARAKRFSRRISSLWRMVLDLTYPVTSYTTGYEFNRGIWKVFGSSEIEDFWVKYFCNSTNITNSTMDIHETGFLWRFIRSSMSLAGLLPPITYNGSMLLDGGYLDNLPVLEMKKKGAKYIIAVDVGSVDDRTPMNYGDTLSGFWVLLNKWNPFSKYPNVPNMMDIQLRLAYVASVNALEIAKKTPGVIYLRPPIDDYATLDFAKFDEIFQVGFSYADELLTKWDKMGKIPSIAGMVDKLKIKNGEAKKSLYRRNSI